MQQDPDTPLYELQDITLGMLGTRDNPSLKAKAAESGTLLRFATELARQHRDQLPRGEALVSAGEALMLYMRATRTAPLRMPPANRQMLADAIVGFNAVREDAGIDFKPKMHLCCQLIRDAAFFGNPRCTGTWLDEGLNSKLAAVCASAHALVWSQRVISSFQHILGPGARASESLQKRKRRS